MTEHNGESGEARTRPSLRERARAANPQPLVPVATCVFACCLWTGCVLADASGLMKVGLAHGLPPLARALLACALAAGAAAALLAMHRMKGTSGDRAQLCDHIGFLTLVAIAALALGAGLRVREEIGRSRTEAVTIESIAAGTRAGQLVIVEATLAAGWALDAFGPDLLARHFRKPARWTTRIERLDFMDERGTRIALDDATGATLMISAGDAETELPPIDTRIGDRLHITGRFLPASRSMLPTRMDRAESMARRGSVGTIVVESPTLIVPCATSRRAQPLHDAFMRTREAMRERVRAALLSGVPRFDGEGSAIDAMLVALVLGDSEVGYESIEQGFRAVGLAHILAISGFNLAVLGWVVAAIAGLFIRDERWRALPVGIAAIVALIVMTPAASAVRSAVMAIMGASARSFGRDWNGDAMIALAAIAMLLHAPSDAAGAGFQLSFACVLALRHLAPAVRARWLAWMPRDDGRSAHPQWSAGWLAMGGEFASRGIAAGIATFLASTPIALAHFGTMQPLGVLLTFACTPLSTITLAIAYPKAIVGSLWIPLTWPLGPVLWACAWIQVVLVDWSLATLGGAVQLSEVSVATALCLLCGIIGMFLLPSRRLRAIATLLALGMLVDIVASKRGAERPVFELTMLAVGDGSAYMLRSGSSLVLFDGGSSSMGGVASAALMPLVAAHGGVVDAIVVSHPNLDHFSALLDIIRFARVRTLLVHPTFVAARKRMPAVDELLRGAESAGTEVRTVAAGDACTIGALGWRFIWPERNFRTSRDNDCSLVSIVEHACGTRVLLSGDIETEPAARLAARSARGETDNACDIAELPHHGSWREAVVSYIAAAKPAIVLQSTAERRFANDRFAGKLPADATRLVTCRDASVRIRADADGTLHIALWDPEAADGWRPAGILLPAR